MSSRPTSSDGLQPRRQECCQRVVYAVAVDPRLDLEASDPECWLVSVLEREQVGKRVSECTLAMPASLAGEEWRPGRAEASALEPPLPPTPLEPGLERERNPCSGRVAKERQRAELVEVLLLVNLEDSGSRPRPARRPPVAARAPASAPGDRGTDKLGDESGNCPLRIAPRHSCEPRIPVEIADGGWRKPLLARFVPVSSSAHRPTLTSVVRRDLDPTDQKRSISQEQRIASIGVSAGCRPRWSLMAADTTLRETRTSGAHIVDTLMRAASSRRCSSNTVSLTSSTLHSLDSRRGSRAADRRQPRCGGGQPAHVSRIISSTAWSSVNPSSRASFRHVSNASASAIPARSILRRRPRAGHGWTSTSAARRQ